MKYRKLGRSGLEASEIGLGLEHLLDKEEKVVVKTIRMAIQGGVNYFDCLSLQEYSPESDTCEGYAKLARAIEGLRDKVVLTFLAYVSKPLPHVQAEFDCYLRTLGTDHTDIFIVACCDKPLDFDAATGEGSLLAFAKQMQSEGKVRHIGFSTHNTELAHRAVASGQFDVLMFPVNPAFDVLDDEESYNSDILGNIWVRAYEYTPGKSAAMPRKSVYAACERVGVGLVAMKPFGGGFILGMETMLMRRRAGFTPLNLLSYALAQTGVSTVIPGCSSVRELKEILKYHTAPAKALDFSEAIANSRWSIRGHCLYCSHCLPCPAGIDIAKVNRALDGRDATQYAALGAKASACVRCGKCMERCPFGVDAITRMERAVEVFGQ